jgi:hypothetical protein
MNQFDSPINQKKMRLWELPKIKGSTLKYRVPHVWPTYIHERRITFSKACGTKVTCYWELFEKHVKNLGTLCFGPLSPPPSQRDEVCQTLFEKKGKFGQKFKALSPFGDFTPKKKKRKACCQQPHGIGLGHWLTRGQNQPNHAHSLVHYGQASRSLTNLWCIHT